MYNYNIQEKKNKKNIIDSNVVAVRRLGRYNAVYKMPSQHEPITIGPKARIVRQNSKPCGGARDDDDAYIILLCIVTPV